MRESERIPVVDTTTKSIEEIATTILHRTGLRRSVF
jgi:regulator of PEP synthase PpsR (kinase-PPPase family)